ncbi:MAG: hypothetical protein PHN72_01070 [Bacilli bacterium]|nr:hypothetical protein [Bacilli bacterium]
MIKEGKKKYVILFIILGIYLVILFLMFGLKEFRNKHFEAFLMVSPSTRWQFTGGEWVDVKDPKAYNNLDFDVYNDNTFLGKFNVVYNEKFYLFDQKKISQKYTGNMLAYRGNRDIDIIKYDEEQIDTEDTSIIQKVLNENEIKYSAEKVSGTKTKLDVNNDGKQETIYVITNVFNNDVTQSDSIFGMSFIIEENHIDYLYKRIDIYENMIKDMCRPTLHSIIDIDKDKKYEFIMSCSYFSQKGTCNSMYDNQENKYEILKGC